MEITIDLTEVARAAQSVSNADISKIVHKNLHRTGLHIVNSIKRSMQKSRGGNVVRKTRGKKRKKKIRGGVLHEQSKPGNPPAIDTGRLVNSVYSKATPFSLEVGANAIYARHLEFGRANRPFLVPAVEAHQQKLADSIVNAVIRSMTTT